MAAAAAGDDGDLGFGGIRAEVDDFVSPGRGRWWG